MNIKKASEQTGVSAPTIRYYERIGLIHPVERNQNGIREFDEEDLKWIDFSRQMRHAGMSVEALVDYLSLFREGDQTIPARKELIAEQIDEMKTKINELTAACTRLEYKLEHYDDHMNPYEKSLKH
ncbi:MAG: MerR family transcriptional regulator [Enterococcus sp.]